MMTPYRDGLNGAAAASSSPAASEGSHIPRRPSGGSTGATSSRGSGNYGGEFSQSLSSVLNAPQARGQDTEGMVTALMQGDYTALWESPMKQLGLVDESSSWVMPTVPPAAGGGAAVHVEDFKEYLAEMGELMARFESIHPGGAGPAAGGGEGEAAVGHEEERARLESMVTVVPPLYLKRGFTLEDPATFDETGISVAGFCEEEQGRLQERLSHFLDVVEQNLMFKIQERKESFYKALDELQELYSEVDHTMAMIAEFRSSMYRLDERLVGHALRIAQLRRRKKNMEELHRKVCLIHTVRQTQQHLQLLLSCSDFVAALDLIAGAKQVLQTDLKGVHALKNTEAQLNEMDKVVHKMMCSEFVSLSLGKDRMLRDTSGVLGKLESNEMAAFDPSSLAEVEDQLLALALALVRVGMLPEVLGEYRAAAVREVLNSIKAVLRGGLPAEAAAATGGGGARAARGEAAGAGV